MSPLFNNRLSVVLCPDQVALLHLGRKLTLRGLERNVLGSEIIRSKPGGASPWSGSLDALGAALPRFAARNTQANVILSNHFVHYALVPWCDNLSDEEEIAYASHCFHEVYGEAADAWEVRVSPNSAGQPALASAVDAGLLDGLRGLLGGAGFGIKSIQPHLMLAFNSCRASLQGRNAWFALLEPGNLCLAALRNGQFTWMRKMRIGEAWHEELSTLLAREAYLADAGGDSNEVLLWAPQLEDEDIPAWGPWHIRQLRPGSHFGQELGYRGSRNGNGGAT